MPSTFDILPDDLLIAILGSLDIRDVISLRRVSRCFDRATRLRSLWVLLAHREVLDRELPWPSYALPLTLVPTRTIEEYTLRALAIDRQWSHGMDPQIRGFSRCIFRPPNSIGWFRIVKGRWLVLELRGRHLELWDLEDELETEPVASYHGLKGMIDGSSVDTCDGSSVILRFSTSSYVTVFLEVDLPHLGECRPTPKFVLLNTFDGYSGLLDAQAGLAIFYRSVSNETPLVRDMRTGSIAYFGNPAATEIPQRFLSARILKEHILLLGPWSMEVFPIAKVRSSMEDDHKDTLAKLVHPSQSLVYPGGEMANHIAVLASPSGSAQPSSWNAGCELSLGIFVREDTRWMRLNVWLDSASGSTTFTSSMRPLFRAMGFRTIASCWGESGQRMLLAGVYKAGIPVRCVVTPSHPVLGDPDLDDCSAFGWSLVPEGGRDLLAGFALDEASGICAVATCSGRIWIDDISKLPSSAQNLSEDNLNRKETPLHPDPSWSILHPIPWPVNVVPNGHLIMYQFNEPMSWSTDVHHHFPMMNDPNCYGGARWFVNEALHIPGPASLVMFTISALYPRWCWSTRIIQVAGGRHIALETDVDSSTYRVKLLGPDVDLTQVPGLLSRYYSIEGVAGVDLDVDYAVVKRYLFWRNQIEDDPNELPLYLW